MAKITYVNGCFVNHENAYVHIDDRGYQFADGVYEVVLAKKNVFIDWGMHCVRLRRSLSEMKIGYTFSDNNLLSLVKDLMEKNALEDAVVYIQITRGVAKREHSFPKGNISPSLIITVNTPSFPTDLEYENGVAVIIMPDIRWKRRDIKTISLLPNILAKQAAAEQNAVEAVLIEDNGYITEGSSSNFFIFDKEGLLRTHPRNNLILGGITRDGIIKVARQAGIKVEEQAFKLSDIAECKGAFLSSTTKHILPVTKFGNSLIAGGLVCKEIFELIRLYKQYIEQQI